MSNLPEVEKAIEEFLMFQSQRRDNEDTQDLSESFFEAARKKRFLEIIKTINSPVLNRFILQPISHPYLDRLGVFKSNRKALFGLKIKDYQVPRSENRMRQDVSLVYVASDPNYQIDLTEEKEEVIAKAAGQNLEVKQPIEGLVLVKNRGQLLTADSSGYEQTIELITPEKFDKAGMFNTVFTSNIQPEEIVRLTEERFVKFVKTLQEASK